MSGSNPTSVTRTAAPLGESVDTAPPPLMALRVRFGDQSAEVRPGSAFSIGRDADLNIDENPYLHRQFLRLRVEAGLWWLENVGTLLSATLTDGSGQVQATLAPGARLPLVFDRVQVVFGAGSTSYELEISSDAAFFGPPVLPTPRTVGSAEETIGHVPLTHSQRQLIVALAEPLLRGGSTGRGEIPSSAEAAQRLGWTLTAFNRKLDNVCEKLDRIGVSGLRGGRDSLATNRRLRLVEYAVATRLVTGEDLTLLGAARP
jgi:hypothetical protein